MNLIQQWESQHKGKRQQQALFVKRLKKQKGKTLNQLAEQTHDAVFSELDCLDCANCCKSIPPIVSRNDTKRIAQHLGMGKKAFTDQYLTTDSDGDTVFKQSPCVFLQADNKCEIYEVRPTACRQYPHTDDYQFIENLGLHATNAQYCPAVFHILERMQRVY